MQTRRDLLKLLSGGTGLMVLRAAATGLPLTFLRQPLAYAADLCAPDIVTAAPDFLLMSLASGGDPFNANVPGSYVTGVVNNPQLAMKPTDFYLGGKLTRAAEPWSKLPAAMLARTAFVHLRTGAIGHNQFTEVTKLMGALKNPDGRGEESLPAAIAQETALAKGTLQEEPVCLSTVPVTMGGQALQALSPQSLSALFTQAASPLNDLAGLRDATIDKLHATLKASGTRSQRSFLDRYAAGRGQARALGDCLGTLLTDALPAVAGESPKDQVLGAIALFKLNVTPSVTITMPFGGDNHNDEGLVKESADSIASIAALEYMWQQISDYGLADHVTFANLNVFGRTLSTYGDAGRSHNQEHHVMTIIGKRVNGGVYGGLARKGTDWGATAINSASGISDSAGDIVVEETLQAAGKTLAKAVGLSDARINKRINGGKVITAAIG